MYLNRKIHVLMILFYWINNCICFGNIEDVEDSYNNMKQLFDCDDVGDMDKYVGCKVEREERVFHFTQLVIIQSLKINYTCQI